MSQNINYSVYIAVSRLFPGLRVDIHGSLTKNFWRPLEILIGIVLEMMARQNHCSAHMAVSRLFPGLRLDIHGSLARLFGGP